MNILITGGVGFIGSHLAEELYRDHDVKIIDNMTTGDISNILHLKNKVKIIKGDILDTNLLKKEFDSIEYVFHLAAILDIQKSIQDPQQTNKVNINGTLNVLKAAKNAGVKRVIFTSSAAVYGNKEGKVKESSMCNPISPYGISKFAAENHCKFFYENYGLETISLRNFNVYGSRQKRAVIPYFLEAIKNNIQPVIYGDGNQTRDFVYVKDVVSANILAMKKNKFSSFSSGAINIGTGKEVSLLKLIEVINKIYNKKIKPEFKSRKEGEIQKSCADINVAKKILDFEPRFSVENGIKDMVNKK